ncbi:MAG TPA: glycosyl transferase [Xanthomonadaceae bacterium]|nr:glycosyl transferase [Xanthomonadaceae bacterium]
MRFELVTETYPPEINGVALTVQSLHDGLIALGHDVGLVRPARPAEDTDTTPALMRVGGAPIPRYPGMRFGLPCGRRLAARWMQHRPDALYIATEGPLGWSALRAAKRLGIPVATGFHTRFDDYVGRYGAAFLSPYVFGWLRRFHNRADATLVPTRELVEQLGAQGFTKVCRLGRAVDTDRFHPRYRSDDLRASWGLAAGDLGIVHVGRIAPEKNLPLLLRCFDALKAERPGARLVLVGDGPARAALAAERSDLVFAGTLRGDALAAHFASADLFCFPSLSETFGNVTLEAMASGLPTVAFDYGAAREHLADGVHGASVPFGDEAAFLERFLQTVGSPRRAAMGAAARSAVEGLSPERVSRDFADLLTALASPMRRAA